MFGVVIHTRCHFLHSRAEHSGISQLTRTCILEMHTLTQTLLKIEGRNKYQPHDLQCAGLHTVNRRRLAELVPEVVGILGADVVDEPPCDD